MTEFINGICRESPCINCKDFSLDFSIDGITAYCDRIGSSFAPNGFCVARLIESINAMDENKKFGSVEEVVKELVKNWEGDADEKS